MIAPTIAQLAKAIAEKHWKPLNYQLLLKTRDEDAAIRRGSIRIIREMYSRIGEEFLVMLPETITFIHELLEDGEEEVEEEMRTTVKVIEGLLGESLQEYLN